MSDAHKLQVLTRIRTYGEENIVIQCQSNLSKVIYGIYNIIYQQIFRSGQ